MPISRICASWYVDRFFSLARYAPSRIRNHTSIAIPIAHDKEARAIASRIWETINLVNLRENVLPTRQRADLILRKGRTSSAACGYSVFLRGNSIAGLIGTCACARQVDLRARTDMCEMTSAAARLPSLAHRRNDRAACPGEAIEKT